MMCRSLRARRFVEVGTSFGISTLYLADAVQANDDVAMRILAKSASHPF